jgi:hypothetical protein
MTTEQTIQSLASELCGYLETRTRDNGDKFICLQGNAPDWAQDVCREAHDSPTVGLFMPDDYRYELISECLKKIAECESDSELEETPYNVETPTYTYDLLQWLASHVYRPSFVDAYIEEIGRTEIDIMGQIRDGYFMELREVSELLISALAKRVTQ